jgi:hypothetical protein
MVQERLQLEGGGLSELTGGNFKDGFIGAGSAAFLSPVGRGINKSLNFEVEAGARSNGWQYLGRTATAATMGGTVTAISGGKFANGAATAAFMHVVNHEVTGTIQEHLNNSIAMKEARKNSYMARAKANGGHLVVDLAEVWLEQELAIERLKLMEEAGKFDFSDIGAGTDTAFYFGPQDHPTNPVGHPVSIVYGGKLLDTTSTYELNYIRVGAALQMKSTFGKGKIPNVIMLPIVNAWNISNQYHQHMTFGKTKWAMTGSSYSFYYHGHQHQSTARRFYQFYHDNFYGTLSTR